MKKALLILAVMGTCSCYHAVPERDVYVANAYIETPVYEIYEPMGAYTSATYAETEIYTSPVATSSAVYIAQSQPEVFYIQEEPEIVYNVNPLLTPKEYKLPQQSHRVGTVPHKKVAAPLPRYQQPETPKKLEKAMPQNPVVIYRPDPAEGRP